MSVVNSAINIFSPFSPTPLYMTSFAPKYLKNTDVKTEDNCTERRQNMLTLGQHCTPHRPAMTHHSNDAFFDADS